MNKVLLIAIGGGIGAVARYGTATLLARWMERSLLPYGTLACNLIGCFLIGLLQGLFELRWDVRPEYRMMMLVGFLGGYTTFSSYGWESGALFRDGQYLAAGANILANNLFGIALVFAGYAIGRAR